MVEVTVGGAEYLRLFDIFWDWSVVVGVITFVWLLHHAFYYVAKDGEVPNIDDIKVGEFPKHYHNSWLEFSWTVVPLILIIYLAAISVAPTSVVWPDPDTVGEEGVDYYEIGVTGQQWFWIFDCNGYEADICDTGVHTDTGKDMLILKKDTTYRLNVTSNDVIHAPYIVQWGAKEDAVPGLHTSIWITPDQTGLFFIDCAEYCGDDHAYMTAILEVRE